MTQDHSDYFTDALEKEGYEYIILLWKPNKKGEIVDAQVIKDVDNIDIEYAPLKNGNRETKKESLITLATQAINGDFD